MNLSRGFSIAQLLLFSFITGMLNFYDSRPSDTLNEQTRAMGGLYEVDGGRRVFEVLVWGFWKIKRYAHPKMGAYRFFCVCHAGRIFGW